MKTNQKFSRFLTAKNNFFCSAFLSLFVMGCNSSFETLPSQIAPDNDQIFSGLLSLESPAQNAYTNSLNQNVEGQCPANSKISISGDIASSPVITSCSTQGRFATNIQWQSNDGEKRILVQVANKGATSGQVNRMIYLDRTAPAMPTISSPASGASTGNSSLTIQGSCEANATIQISGDIIGGPISANCLSTSFSQVVQITSSLGTKNISISQADRAGNISGSRTLSQNFVGAPSAPTITSPTPNAWTNSLNVSVAGSCSTGNQVVVSTQGGDASATCAGNVYSVNLTLSSADGTKPISAVQNNTAGSSPAATVSVNLDRNAPAAPTISSPATNATVSSTALTLAGGCEANSTLVLTGHVQSSPIEFACSGTSFSRSINLTSGAGSKSLSLTQRDRAGNISSARTQSVTLSSPAPGAPTITSPLASAYLGDRTVSVTGSCLSGHTVNLTGQITVSPTLVTCTSSNNYVQSVILTSGDGAKSISATQSNSGSISSAVSVSVTLDTTAPAAPTVSSPASGSTVTAVAQTIQGGCETSASVRISGDIVTSPTTVSCVNSGFSVNVNLTSGNGSKSISLSQTDRAGHNSPARDITLTLNTSTNPNPNPNWGPRNSVRVLLSGHSLLDNPLPDFLATTANRKSDSHAWNQQNSPGSPLRVRTQGDGNWAGYRSGKNRSSDGMNIINEVRNPQTIGAGQRYDTLVITERHDILSVIEWENTIGYLRHFHDLMISGNASTRTFFYHSWWDINKSSPTQWITHEKNAQFTWECVASKINASLGSSGRSDRLRLLPSGGALVDLVERVINNEVSGISGTTLQKMNMIFRDNVHLTDLGNYYMSLVVYSSIYGKSASGSLPDAGLGISNSVATQLQTIAWNFVNSYLMTPFAPAW